MTPRTAASPLRPGQHAEQHLVTAILTNVYPAGTALPAERELAAALGVTRPTLRETLQRLAREGWVVIRHGKPTRVNNYWQEGGLGMLATLAKYAALLPNGLIQHLLQVRVDLLPTVARLAADRRPQSVQRHLAGAGALDEDPAAFTRYDWQLQTTMARHCGNPVYPLILNDFGPVFAAIGPRYFAWEKARRASRGYYRRLAAALERRSPRIETLVRQAMAESIDIWRALKARGEATP